MSGKVIKKFETEMKDLEDRIKILETKTENLEKIPQELKNLRETLGEILGMSLYSLDIDSCIRDFPLIIDKININLVLQLVGDYLQNMKKFYESFSQSTLFKDTVSELMRRWMVLIIHGVSIKKVKFDDFCSTIMKNLGSDLAKKTVPLEDIVRTYGADNASKWKKLVE